jgi:hypothetical protein
MCARNPIPTRDIMMYRPHARSGNGAYMCSRVAPGSGKSTFSADQGGNLKFHSSTTRRLKTSKKSVCADVFSLLECHTRCRGRKDTSILNGERIPICKAVGKKGAIPYWSSQTASTEPPRLGRTVLVLCQCLPVQTFVLPAVKWISECEWDCSTIQTEEHAPE